MLVNIAPERLRQAVEKFMASQGYLFSKKPNMLGKTYFLSSSLIAGHAWSTDRYWMFTRSFEG